MYKLQTANCGKIIELPNNYSGPMLIGNKRISFLY